MVNTELQQKFLMLEKLQVEKNIQLEINNGQQKVMPFCQAPPCWHESLDKATKAAVEQAKIWNDIRGFLGSDKKLTLWQKAIELNFPVHRFGQENIFNLDANELMQLRQHLGELI